ncbi:hypothetical protein MBLNU13_g03067t1 [Cladosporium sp. NU13]
MIFTTKGSAVMLLLVTIFSVLSLSAALPVTTDLAIRDCVHVNGGSGCATFDQAASALDIKGTNDNILDGSQSGLTNLKRTVPAGSTLQCDDVTAPLSKDAVRSNFVEKYCGRIDGEVFRKSGVDEVCTELITTMYMFVNTINGDWVYVNEKNRCIDTFNIIIDGCSDDKTFRGGTLIIDDHVRYILEVFKVGGMTGKEPKCLSRS